MRFRYYFLALLAVLFLWHYADGWPPPQNGVLAPAWPVQKPLSEGENKPWAYRNYMITPLATYSVKARIMSREPYWLDRCAAVSPLDFALGWGSMSDPQVYKALHIAQGTRWYTWHYWGESPINPEEVPHESANTHLIPATGEIAGRLSDFRAGDVVKLSGYLVEVAGTDGWHWRSSLTRDDTGGGSCEVMWVKTAEKVGR